MIVNRANPATASPSADDGVEPIALNAKQAAALFGLSERAWRRAHAAGLIPAPLKIFGAVRWGSAELRLWAEAGCPNRQAWESMKNVAGPRRPFAGVAA